MIIIFDVLIFTHISWWRSVFRREIYRRHLARFSVPSLVHGVFLSRSAGDLNGIVASARAIPEGDVFLWVYHELGEEVVLLRGELPFWRFSATLSF